MGYKNNCLWVEIPSLVDFKYKWSKNFISQLIYVLYVNLQAILNSKTYNKHKKIKIKTLQSVLRTQSRDNMNL